MKNSSSNSSYNNNNSNGDSGEREKSHTQIKRKVQPTQAPRNKEYTIYCCNFEKFRQTHSRSAHVNTQQSYVYRKAMLVALQTIHISPPLQSQNVQLYFFYYYFTFHRFTVFVFYFEQTKNDAAMNAISFVSASARESEYATQTQAQLTWKYLFRMCWKTAKLEIVFFVCRSSDTRTVIIIAQTLWMRAVRLIGKCRLDSGYWIQWWTRHKQKICFIFSFVLCLVCEL